jgi:hypothetical protein
MCAQRSRCSLKYSAGCAKHPSQAGIPIGRVEVAARPGSRTPSAVDGEQPAVRSYGCDWPCCATCLAPSILTRYCRSTLGTLSAPTRRPICGRYVRSLVLWHCQTKSRLAWDVLIVLLLLQTLITIPYEVNSALAPARTHTLARTGARTHAPVPTHTRARPSAGYCSAHTHPHRRAVRVCIHTHTHTNTHTHTHTRTGGRAVQESADRKRSDGNAALRSLCLWTRTARWRTGPATSARRSTTASSCGTSYANGLNPAAHHTQPFTQPSHAPCDGRRAWPDIDRPAASRCGCCSDPIQTRRRTQAALSHAARTA